MRAFLQSVPKLHRLPGEARYCTTAQLARIVARELPVATIVTERQSRDLRSYHLNFDRVSEILSFAPHCTLGEHSAEVADTFGDGTILSYRLPIYHKPSQRFSEGIESRG